MKEKEEKSISPEPAWNCGFWPLTAHETEQRSVLGQSNGTSNCPLLTFWGYQYFTDSDICA